MLLFLAAIGILRKDLLKLPFTMLCVLDFGLTFFLAAVSGHPLPTKRVLLPLWPVVGLALVETCDALCLGIKSTAWSGVPVIAANALALVLLVLFYVSSSWITRLIGRTITPSGQRSIRLPFTAPRWIAVNTAPLLIFI